MNFNQISFTNWYKRIKNKDKTRTYRMCHTHTVDENEQDENREIFGIISVFHFN